MMFLPVNRWTWRPYMPQKAMLLLVCFCCVSRWISGQVCIWSWVKILKEFSEVVKTNVERDNDLALKDFCIRSMTQDECTHI
jgi:hypothetical protein